MAKKIIGWILVLAGIGNFIGNFAKASGNRPDAFKDIGFGIFFLGLGIYLIASAKKKDTTPTPPAKQS
jgi:uncharacterized membrane protein YfcA